MKSHRPGVVVTVVLVIMSCTGWFLNHHALAADGTAIQCVETKGTDVLFTLNQPATDTPFQPQDYGNLPLYFIENRGQVESQVTYYARGKGQTIFFSDEGVVITLSRGKQHNGTEQISTGVHPVPTSQIEDSRTVRPSVVLMQPIGMKKDVTITATDLQECKVSYFIGSDPDQWQTDIPTYAGVLYHEVFTGVDLKFYGNNKNLEYDIIVQPGANPDQVRFAFQGVEHLEVTPAGDLALHLPDGEMLLQQKPIVYQEIAGIRVMREGTFAVHKNLDRCSFGFTVAAYDHNHTLIIDPVLAYSTYLGGCGSDYGYAIAVDTTGAAYVTGKTASTDFPTHNPFQGTYGLGDCDAFVAKLNPAGNTFNYVTYLGGNDDDHGWDIAIDAAGAAYVIGTTQSSDFPTHNPFQATLGGNQDAFVAKLSPAGNALTYATYFGGSHWDQGYGIAVDTDTSAYVTGITWSDNFYLHNPLQGSLGGDTDAFVAKFNPAGDAVTYSTYLGGTADSDGGHKIVVDNTGAAYVTGYTWSTNFPATLNAPQDSLAAGADAFIAKLNPAGDELIYATFLGGNNIDVGVGIAVDSTGAAYVTGKTDSTNFPTHNPIHCYNGSEPGDCFDAFVTKLSPAGDAFIYSTYLGGNSDDNGDDIAVDSTGAAYVTGGTASSDFPIHNALQRAKSGNSDAFVAKLNPAGNALSCATYLGGSAGEEGQGIAIDSTGAVYVTGSTSSSDFPTHNAAQGTFGGGYSDIFLTKIRPGSCNSSVFQLLLLE